MTRSSFILRGALAAGAVYGASAVTPFVSQALAGTGGGDVEILNFALTLEYLEAAFYNVKGKEIGLSGKAKSLRARCSANRRHDHVSALTAAIKQLGGNAGREADVRVPGEQPELVPRARLGAREHRRRRLQRRRAVDEEQGGAGVGRQHRADRGASRGRDRPADRQEPDAERRLRRAADRSAGAGEGQPLIKE